MSRIAPLSLFAALLLCPVRHLPAAESTTTTLPRAIQLLEVPLADLPSATSLDRASSAFSHLYGAAQASPNFDHVAWLTDARAAATLGSDTWFCIQLALVHRTHPSDPRLSAELIAQLEGLSKDSPQRLSEIDRIKMDFILSDSFPDLPRALELFDVIMRRADAAMAHDAPTTVSQPARYRIHSNRLGAISNISQRIARMSDLTVPQRVQILQSLIVKYPFLGSTAEPNLAIMNLLDPRPPGQYHIFRQ